MYQQLDEWMTSESLAAEPGASYAVDSAAYNLLTHRIIGGAMQVHALPGSGFPEVIYQRALAIELAREEVVAQREVETPIYFRGQQIGTRRVDFLAAGPAPDQPILVELKAAAELANAHLAQVINYLEAYRLHVGVLLNFGASSLYYRRFTKTSFAS